VHAKSSPPPLPPPPPVEIHINGRNDTTATVISSPSPVDIRHDQCSTMNTTISASQVPRPIIERRTDERTIKPIVNSVSSPLTIPIEISHDQRTVMSINTIASPPPSSSIGNRSFERVVTAATTNIISIPSQSTETRIDQSTVTSVATSNSPPPPPRPPPPPLTNNEVIYTEVIKHHERPLSSHHIDLVKSRISPSRSFIIPTKSPSISSKNSSFNYQRPSRSSTTTNFSYNVHKSKPMQPMIAPDRISLYSQRSNKQADVGVTIKNLSECIDRVGIVFDETNRPNTTSSAGLTTVDLIREQLTTSSTSKPTGSLLDKLYKSNSSTRLPTSPSRTSMNIVIPRSKSQQTTRTHNEQPSIPK